RLAFDDDVGGWDLKSFAAAQRGRKGLLGSRYEILIIGRHGGVQGPDRFKGFGANAWMRERARGESETAAADGIEARGATGTRRSTDVPSAPTPPCVDLRPSARRTGGPRPRVSRCTRD